MQGVSVGPTPGGVTVTGYFVDNSSAVGVLLITFSLTNEDDISYVFVPRPRESQDIETTLTGLSEGDYQVSFFVVDKDGLPFNRSANLPRNISVSEGTCMYRNNLLSQLVYLCTCVHVQLVFCQIRDVKVNIHSKVPFNGQR